MSLDRLGLFPSPTRYLRSATVCKTQVHLVYSEGDKGLIDLRIRAGRSVAGLISAGGISLDVVEGMDHSMFDPAKRAIVLDALRSVCVNGSSPVLDYDASV